MKFFIVNETEKPHPALVAYENLEGTLNYLDRSKSAHDGMPKDQATPLEEFGFHWRIGKTEVIFSWNSPSTAYYKNGKGRNWEGDGTFSRPIPEDAALD